MIKFKFDVLDTLRQHGYTPTRLRAEKILGESTIQKVRTNNRVVSIQLVDTICRLLHLRVEDVIEYQDD